MSPENSTPQSEFKQIDEQLAAGQAASVLVEKRDGEIVTGQVMDHGEDNTRVWLANLNVENDGGRLPTKVVSAEQLTDKHQEALAEKLAGVALRGVEAEKPVEEFDAEAANLERSISEALAEKKRAQQDGRGEDSTYWGQVAGQYTRQLEARRKR